MPTVTANGITIYYERQGEGHPLLLISGLGYGLWQWHKMTPQLAEHFEVVTFDNRGAGRSDKPAGPYSVRMLADDTAGLLQKLQIERAIVLGHSMGGFVAQQLALTYPSLVSHLILAATNFGGPNHVPLTPQAMAVLTDRSGDPRRVIERGIEVATAPGFTDRQPQLVEELVRYRFSNPVPPAAYYAQLQVGLGLLSAEAAFEQRLHHINVPTLIIFGEHDRVVPVANATLLAAAIDNSKVVMLPDAGHIFPLETPQAAAEAVVQWVKQS